MIDKHCGANKLLVSLFSLICIFLTKNCLLLLVAFKKWYENYLSIRVKYKWDAMSNFTKLHYIFKTISIFPLSRWALCDIGGCCLKKKSLNILNNQEKAKQNQNNNSYFIIKHKLCVLYTKWERMRAWQYKLIFSAIPNIYYSNSTIRPERTEPNEK